MDSGDFTDGPGAVEEHEGLSCYRPASLPPELDHDDDLLRVYGDAQYALGRLATLQRDLDNPGLLIAPFVHREAAMSSQVEGTNVTISDIYQHEVESKPARSAAKQDDVREAYNYVDAVKHGFERVDAGEAIDLDRVCDLHEQLLDDVRGGEDRPGELRDVPVYIGARDGDPKSASFIPPKPADVPLLLDQLFAYVRRGEYPPLIDVALTHYQFEAIHPFRDGNGRLGRLLVMLQLYDSGLLPGPYLYLSAYFRRYGAQYREKLLAVSMDGAWGDWITFVLNAIAEQAIDAYDCGVELKTLRETYRNRYPSSPTTREVVDYLFEQPYLTASRAVEATGRSPPAVYDAIAALEADDIITETTGKQSYKVYDAPEILSVLAS
jgi:Fic family protein